MANDFGPRESANGGSASDAPNSRRPLGIGSDRNANRRVRVFISSTFRDFREERDELMTQTWPTLRRFCRERQVELVEVDLRWGISEAQATRKETLKLCLDEVHACRPYFIGLLGERYGWTPGPEAFTRDLIGEQPWLADAHDKSVTELEIQHGTLNDPEVAGRSYFYFRDPGYARARGDDFQSETPAAAARQAALKERIRAACRARNIPLRENYSDPRRLAAMVLEDLKLAIERHFPEAGVPDALEREAQGHEAFATFRRRTYVGRPHCFAALDAHAAGDAGPLALLGDSGAGKSALLANWLEHWRGQHAGDFVYQHYIGSTPDSADLGRLVARLLAEIKRWTRNPEALPGSREELLKAVGPWLVRARAHARGKGVRFVLVLDALNQLEDGDHARLLGWLPEYPLNGPLRVIVSTLPGRGPADDPLQAVRDRGWQTLRVEPLAPDERRRMIRAYLARFGKQLDAPRVDRLAGAEPTANPLYLKILLDDLRVTGTYELLDERLDDYLESQTIPALLKMVLARYRRDYERDRPGLVGEALSLVYASRRGLSETELLEVLRPPDRAQLPPALWTPLRAALEDSLIDRGGILNFAHDFLRSAVEETFACDQDRRDDLQLRLADYFEAQDPSPRNCDELPWLLRETESNARLRACLLEIDRFLLIQVRDPDELHRYWVDLGVERAMGRLYRESFDGWAATRGSDPQRLAYAANQLGFFLSEAALNAEAEPLMRRALAIDERDLGKDHPRVASELNNLAQLLQATGRRAEAEPLMRRALAIDQGTYREDRPDVDRDLNNLARLLQATGRPAEAEPLMRRALAIDEQSFGKDHPSVGIVLNNLAQLLEATNRLAEAEPLMRRALAIDEQTFDRDNPAVAATLNNLSGLLCATGRLTEAEPLMRRVLALWEQGYGAHHPNVAIALNNLAQLLQATNRLSEAEPLMRRALAIDERSFGEDHPDVARDLNNLGQLLRATHRLAEAEPVLRRALLSFLKFTRTTGHRHPHLQTSVNNYGGLLMAMGHSREEAFAALRELAPDQFC